MTEMTTVQLDSTSNDDPVSLRVGLAMLAARGMKVSRATLYRWNAVQVDAGRPALVHQPSGPNGRVFIVPSEIQAFVRSRCFDDAPVGRRHGIAGD